MINFDEGTALMDMLDMIREMLSEAGRDYDNAIQRLDYHASEYEYQIAREKLIETRARYDAIEQAHAKALNIYNNMICEAAGLPYFN